MPTKSRMNLPRPKDWTEFEDIACEVWKIIWQDPNTHKNGRQGQPQHGVDVWGRPGGGKDYAGVQCKGKEDYEKITITEKELHKEIEKAKSFKPAITEYIVATTGKRDESIQTLAREITSAHLEQNLFAVDVWFWEDIQQELVKHKELCELFYPDIFSQAVQKDDIDHLSHTTQEILSSQTTTQKQVSNIEKIVQQSAQVLIDRSPGGDLQIEYSRELDEAKQTLNDYNPESAVEYLMHLRERIFDNCGDPIKYRLTSMLGSAHLMMQDYSKAAELYFEAYQYKQDEEAKANRAIAYLLTNESEQALEICEQILEDNPLNTKVTTLLIRSQGDGASLEEIINKVPNSLKDKPEVCHSLALLGVRCEQLEEAEIWFRRSIECMDKELPEIRAAFADFLAKYKADIPPYLIASRGISGNEETIIEALEQYGIVLNEINGTELSKIKHSWWYNSGLLKSLLSRIDEALDDFERALVGDPNNERYLKSAARIYADLENISKAESYLRRAVDSNKNSDAAIMLAELLRNTDSQEALLVLGQFLKMVVTKEQESEASHLMVLLYIDELKYEKAEELLQELLEKEPEDPGIFLLWAIWHKAQRMDDQAKDILKQATKYVDESTRLPTVLNLCIQLSAYRLHDEVINILSGKLEPNQDNTFQRRLANAYYQTEKTEEALNICQNVESALGPIRFYSEMQSAIHEGVGDLSQAKAICETYLIKYSEDLEMKVRMGVIDLRSNRHDLVNELLNSEVNISELTLDTGIQLAHLYITQQRSLEALSILYELRRANYNNPEAHLKYAGAVFQMKDLPPDFADQTTVEVDSAFLLEDDSGVKTWLVIESGDDCLLERSEISPTHEISLQAIHKKTNDTFEIPGKMISNRRYKILSIKHKYIYALHHTMEQFNTLFPEADGMERVEVDFSETPKPGLFSKVDLMQQLDQQQRHFEMIENLYRQGQVTIGTIARSMNTQPNEVWGSFINNKRLGIRCCLGSQEEFEKAHILQIDDRPLAVDIIAISTFFGLSLQDMIIEIGKRLLVSQTTIDIVHEVINRRRGFESEGFLQLFKSGTDYMRREVSKDDIDESIEYFEALLQWLMDNTKITPIPLEPNLKTITRREMNELLGTSFADTALIAAEHNALIYSDDFAYRALVENELGCSGIWTQALISDACRRGIISKAEYNESTIKLASSNYHHTRIDADILFLSAQKAKWEPAQPFIAIAGILDSQSTLVDSVQIIAAFLYKLWLQLSTGENRVYLLMKLLDLFVRGRNSRQAIVALREAINRQFVLLPIAEHEILSLIALWGKLHVV